MIRRDFDLEEMKYFLHLVGQSTDDYLYILDLTNDKAVYSKSITNVFALDSEEFSNAMQELVKVVHPDDIDMLMNDIEDGMNGRKSSHNLEYRWKTVDGEYVAINCRGQYIISHGAIYLIGRISEIGKQSRFDNNTGLYREIVLENVYNEFAVSADYVFLMGLAYMNNGLFDKAIDEFNKAKLYKLCKIEGCNSYKADYNIGVIYECLGNKEKALENYKKCGRYDPALNGIKRIGCN